MIMERESQRISLRGALDKLRSINKKLISREWLLFLFCVFVGLGVMPLISVLQELAMHETRLERLKFQGIELKAPIENKTRALIRDSRFQKLSTEQQHEVMRGFLQSQLPEFSRLNLFAQSLIVLEVIDTYEPQFVKVGRSYKLFFNDFWEGSWVLSFIPYFIVQFVRSVFWAIRTLKSAI